jgi:hypothetical protein
MDKLTKEHYNRFETKDLDYKIIIFRQAIRRVITNRHVDSNIYQSD